MADASIGPPSQVISLTIPAGETVSPPFRLAGYFIAAHAGLSASVAVHTFTDNPSNGEFVRMAGYTFWFRAVVVDPNEDVLIGANLAASITNLLAVVAVATTAELFTADVAVASGPAADQITVTQTATGPVPSGDYSSNTGTWDIGDPGVEFTDATYLLYTSFDAGETWQGVVGEDGQVTYVAAYLSCQATGAADRRATEGLDYCRLQFEEAATISRAVILVLAQI